MKTCPYCAEEIQDAAIVCKHCGRALTDQPLPPSGRTASAPMELSRPRLPFATPALILGLLGLFYFFAVFDVSVMTDDRLIGDQVIQGRRVVNIAKLADRQAGLAISGLIFLVGVGLSVVNTTRRKR